MKGRNIILILGMFLIPLFAFLWVIAPLDSTWHVLGMKLNIHYWTEWRTFLWQLGIFLSTMTAAMLVYVHVPRITDWKVLILLGELFLINGYYFLKSIFNVAELDSMSVGLSVVGITIMSGLTYYVRISREPSLEDQYRNLNFVHQGMVEDIKNLNRHELADLAEAITNIGTAADLMEDHHIISRWASIIMEEHQKGNGAVGNLYLKMSNIIAKEHGK